MNRILSYVCISTLLFIGIGEVKADTTEDFKPVTEVYYRTKLDAGVYSWNSGYPKSPSETNVVFAGHQRAGMFVLQKYKVENLASVKSITLTLTGTASGNANASDALAIWSFASNDWSKSSDAATLADAVNTKVGLDLNTTGTPTGTPLKDVSNSKSVVDTDYRACYYIITGDQLAELKSNAESDGTFTLLITNKTGDMSNGSSGDRKFYSTGHTNEAYQPKLTVTYYAATVKDGTVVTGYSSLSDAMTAAKSATADDITVTINENQNLTARVEAITGKTINFVAGRDGVTVTNTAANTLSFLAGNSGKQGTINVGNAAHRLTFTNSAASTNSVVEIGNGDANTKITFTNVTFSSISSSNTLGLIKIRNSSGSSIYLTDVIFDNCAATATDAGIIYSDKNDQIYVGGTLAFETPTGYCFRLKGRIRENNLTTTDGQLFTIYSDGIALNSSAVVMMKPANRNAYTLVNADRCVVPKGMSSNDELVVSEAYTLSVSAANAATLVLPFATKIPEDVKAYTLNYTAGNGYVKATEVETTLLANTPVLVNAAEGVYKFNAATRATSATPASTTVNEEDRTVGALIGVYQTTTVPTGSYILAVKHEQTGFYRADGSTNTVNAYRAYLTADGAGGRLDIVFDENITGIVAPDRTTTDNRGVYDLQGRRVGQPQKGLYIVNGKKVIIK